MSNQEMEPPKMKTKKQRGGVLYPFPGRLHKLLQESESDPDLACLISWNEDGTSFHVHDKKTFEREIQPKYFAQSKYASFRRQLNLWSFQRISGSGVHCKRFGSSTKSLEGFYTYPLFKRDEPQLCEKMERSGVTPTSISSKAKKQSSKGESKDDGTKHHNMKDKTKINLSHHHLDTGGGNRTVTQPQESASISSSSCTSISSLSNNTSDGLMPFQEFPINSTNELLQQKKLSKDHLDASNSPIQDFSIKMMDQLKLKELYLRTLLEDTKKQQEEVAKKKVRKVSSADDSLGLYHSLCNEQKQRKKEEDELKRKHSFLHISTDMAQSGFLSNNSNIPCNGMGSDKTHLRRGRLSCNISKGDADYMLLLLEDDEEDFQE